MSPAPASNFHGTALVIGDRGVLIAGESGSGKTTLALALITEHGRDGGFAALVSDDQVLLDGKSGRLVCRAPEAIRGLVEVYGRTPQRVAAETACVVDLLVRLVPAEAAPRYGEDAAEMIAGCEIPCLLLKCRNVPGATAAIASYLAPRPFR